MMSHLWRTQQHQLLVRTIRQTALPLPTKHLLLHLLQQALDQAALEEAEGKKVVWLGGSYQLTAWALQFKVAQATLHSALQQAEEAELLRLVPDPHDAAAGILIWTVPSEAGPSRPRPALGRVQANSAAHSDHAAQSATPGQPTYLTQGLKGRPPRQVWATLRKPLLERDERTCQYCGHRTGSLACDHALPVSRGGRITLDNLVTACRACNSSKATKTVEEWTLARARQVRKGGRSWSPPHFHQPESCSRSVAAPIWPTT